MVAESSAADVIDDFSLRLKKSSGLDHLKTILRINLSSQLIDLQVYLVCLSYMDWQGVIAHCLLNLEVFLSRQGALWQKI
jgi:hypothetical protein